MTFRLFRLPLLLLVSFLLLHSTCTVLLLLLILLIVFVRSVVPLSSEDTVILNVINAISHHRNLNFYSRMT